MRGLRAGAGRRERAAAAVLVMALVPSLVGTTSASATVDGDAPGLVVEHDTGAGPGEPAVLQYTDALGVPVTVTAQDDASPAEALTAEATGLPDGLALSVTQSSPDGQVPGDRTWAVTGGATAAPGAYPVEVEVRNQAGDLRRTSFRVEVVPEDARVRFEVDRRPIIVVDRKSAAATADGSGSEGGDGPAGSGSSADVPGDPTVMLKAEVWDSAATSQSTGEAPADTTVGDIATATVTFVDRTSGDVLCVADVDEVEPGFGRAACDAEIEPSDEGRSVTVGMVVGGRYTRDDRADDHRLWVRANHDFPDTRVPHPYGLADRVLARRFSLGFASDDEPQATFRCTLNSVPYRCGRAATFRRLQTGPYTLTVAAVAPDGRVDPTPVRLGWHVPHDDRALHRRSGWRVLRTDAAFRGRLLGSNEKGATLALPVVDAVRVAPVLPDSRSIRLKGGMGRFALYLGKERIRRYTARDIKRVWYSSRHLPGVTFDEPVTGTLRLVALGRRPVFIDGLSVQTADRDR